ncbi:MAG: membrane protein insertion efficiency factor YidD [Bacteroidetes bacterium]|nr:membrane protein insertion efficiency factor YidD [Bacteroidota bacterium]
MRKWHIFQISFFFFLSFQIVNAQQEVPVNVGSLIIDKNITETSIHIPAKRKILSLEQRTLMGKVNPMSYLSAGLLFFYQRVLSEQIQANCVYHISCSEYTKKQIEKRGLIIGILKGCNQLNNCFTGIMSEYPEYKISEDLKVINSIGDEE